VIVVWAVGLVAGMAVATMASRRAVVDALKASTVSRIPLGAIGATVMAVGTDLPEIANSIMAALGGHGDLVLGDAAGSAMTQVTLIMAILLVVAVKMRVDRHSVGVLGGVTALALGLVALLVRDGVLGRLDGLLLVGIWIGALVLLEQVRPDPPEPVVTDARRAIPFAVRTVGWLLVVGVAAAVVVRSFVELTDALGVPELVASAIVLSLGTSLPELVVDWTAIRRGAVALALGDLFGSSLLDATLAVGIGPALRAVEVSPDTVAVALITGVAVAAATGILIVKPRHRWPSSVALLLVYLVATAGLVVYSGAR
jgi:cation:H+ antiporter